MPELFFPAREIHHYSMYSRIVADHLLSLAADLPGGGAALDAGCGVGYFTRMLGRARPGAWSWHGFDCDPIAMESLSGLTAGRFTVGDITAIDYADGFFDLVLCLSVLEHIAEDQVALDELIRVTKPGGQLIISVPCLDGWAGRTRLRNFGHQDPASPEYHVRPGYAAADLIADLTRRGLTMVDRRDGMFVFSEMIMDFTKLGYFLTANNLDSQASIADSGSSLAFRAYKRIFPLLYMIERIERRLLANRVQGHIITLRVRKPAENLD